MKRAPTIFLSAAEASGDQRGAQLIEALRRRLPEARFVGAAGQRMAAAGCEVLADMTRHANMLARGVAQLRYFHRTIKALKKAIRTIRPDVHVPIDSPAINWHLAAASKKIGVPVVYYVAPQVWAWAPWRVKKLARLTDRVACILPFEEEYFRSRGVQAAYVGHPLLDTMPPRPVPMPDLLDAWAGGDWKVALLPGSRRGEIHDHTRALLEVAAAIRRRWGRAVCTLVADNDADAERIRRQARGAWPNGVQLAVARTPEVLAESHFAVTKSGTITLELAHFGVPMVVFYRVHWLMRVLHRVLGQWGVPTRLFSLVNILAGRRIVPELIPWGGKVQPLRESVLEAMGDLGYLVETRQTLLETIALLRTVPPASAADRAAELICGLLSDRGQ